MKKHHLLILLVLIALNTTAVFAADGEYRFSPESRNSTSYMNCLLETEQAIYMVDPARSLLMYLDETDMTWYPLCNRPECMHYVDTFEMKSDCNAFINAPGTGGIVFWKERLYYFEYPMEKKNVITLSSMNTDGTDHRIEREIEQTSAITPLLNNGKAFVICDYLGERSCQVFVYDFDEPKRDPELIWEEKDPLIPVFYEDWIYYFSVDEKAERVDIYRMKQDGTNREQMADDLHFDIGIEEDFSFQYLEGKLSVYYYDTGEEKVLWENDGEYGDINCLEFDGEYFYLISPETKMFLVLDRNGNLLEKLNLPDNKENMRKKEEEFLYVYTRQEQQIINEELVLMQLFANNLVGVSRDYIFVTDKYMATHYIERAEIGSGACEWKTIRMYTDDK